jgi:hypothetical protein
MGKAFHLSKTQMLILVLVFLSLLVTTLLVLHAAVPNLFHAITSSSSFIALNRHH